MAREDGSVIIATILDTEGVKKGTIEVEKELVGLGDSADKANKSVGNDLAGGFKKLGKAIAAAGVVDMLVDFGKEAIETGSDLEEVQNVVDVTFTNMSDKVNQFAKDAQKSAGLSEKMAKQYVGTFGAMADSFGFTEAEAYNMSTALTQLTGDVASFYNLSQDEAMNKLKGVFTGETEALKELGVVMTQTALDSYAMANGFGKTTSAMTEQEKVALRYQFVMDQLAASSGDFVRTQDSWANQSKILALQWESLMATIGSGLIDVLSPGMEFLNEKVLPALKNFAEKFAEALSPEPSKELTKSLKNAEKAVKAASEQFEDSAKQVESNALAADYYKKRLEELEKAGINTTESQIAYKAVIDQINALYPDLNLKISEQTGLIDDNSRAALENLEVQKQKYMMMAVEEEMTAIYQAQGEAQAALAKALYDKEQINMRLAIAEQQLAESLNISSEEVQMLADQVREGITEVNTLDGRIVVLTGDQVQLATSINNSNDELGRLNGKIEEGQSAVADYENELTSLRKTYGLSTQDTQKATDAQAKNTAATKETLKSVRDLKTEYDNAHKSAKNSIDAQIGLFEELKVKSDKSASDIVKNWESQQKALENYRSNLEKAINMGLDEALVAQLSDGSAQSMAILDEFVNSTDVSVDDINAAFRKTEEAKETTAAVMADIATDMGSKFKEIEKTVSSSMDQSTARVEEEIRQMQKYINSLKGKTVTVKIKQVTTKSTQYSGDASLSNPSNQAYSLREPEVPYLAKGTVIPPNAPFMAVLGDQRHGTNIEAPLSTIQEAVANVLEGAIVSGFAAMIKEQKVTQEILKNIEIGDTVIGQAVDRYNEQNNIIRGGPL